MNEELKKCPFCGGKAKFHILSHLSNFPQMSRFGFSFNIRCDECFLELPNKYELICEFNENGYIKTITDDRSTAIEAWNRRVNDGKAD